MKIIIVFFPSTWWSWFIPAEYLESPPLYVSIGTTGWCVVFGGVMFGFVYVFFFSHLTVISNKGSGASWRQVFQWEICPACREALGCGGKQGTMTLSSLGRCGNGSGVAWLSARCSYAQPGSHLGQVLGQVNVCPQKNICSGVLWIPYTSCASH